MDVLTQIISWIVNTGPSFVLAVNGVLIALIVLFAMIPGEQPEKFLQGVVDFLSKYSKK